MTVLAPLLPWPGESLISRAPALACRMVLAREFAGLPESFHLLKSRRERGGEKGDISIFKSSCTANFKQG